METTAGPGSCRGAVPELALPSSGRWEHTSGPEPSTTGFGTRRNQEERSTDVPASEAAGSQ